MLIKPKNQCDLYIVNHRLLERKVSGSASHTILLGAKSPRSGVETFKHTPRLQYVVAAEPLAYGLAVTLRKLILK